MTKQHFIALADHIRIHNRCSSEPFTAQQLEVLTEFCRAQNSRFDTQRWLDYVNGVAGPNGGTIKKVKKAGPPTLGPCSCKRGIERDNCPRCEGSGQEIHFAALRAFNGGPV